MTNFDDVGTFHAKFDLPVADPAHGTPILSSNAFDRNVTNFRENFMHEELEEFERAVQERDLAGMADALVDLVYVAMGTAHYFGLPWQTLWDDVQRANMSKERATDAGDPRSKRGSALDVVKPVGWQGPQGLRLLHDRGFSA